LLGHSFPIKTPKTTKNIIIEVNNEQKKQTHQYHPKNQPIACRSYGIPQPNLKNITILGPDPQPISFDSEPFKKAENNIKNNLLIDDKEKITKLKTNETKWKNAEANFNKVILCTDV